MDITKDLAALPPIKPLCLHLGVWEADALDILRFLKNHDADPQLIDGLEREIEVARDAALDVRANWQMGIVEEFFRDYGNTEA